MIHVTAHAIQRFQERVANLSAEAIVAYLNTAPFRLAKCMGAVSVKLGSRHRALFSPDGAIVTIAPADMKPGQLDRRRNCATGTRIRPVECNSPANGVWGGNSPDLRCAGAETGKDGASAR